MNLILTDNGQYALSLSADEWGFLGHSLVMSLTHTGDAEYEIATGRPKSAAEQYLDVMRQTVDEAGGYVLTLAQSDLDFVLTTLKLCVTHVSNAEYEIVIGRRKEESAAGLADLEDQAEQAFSERIRRELDSNGGWQIVLARMGDLSLLADEVLADRLAAEASEQGIAIEGQERQRAILQQAKIDALLAELERRGADLDGILMDLLRSDDAGVRFTASSRLLGSNPAARLTLEALAERRKPQLSYAARLALLHRKTGAKRARS